jgi:hypothetical protein
MIFSGQPADGMLALITPSAPELSGISSWMNGDIFNDESILS